MRTDELRSLLHDRGDEVHDAGTTARIDAVHDRVRAVRRRRTAVAGGGVVAAVAAVALAVVPGIGGTPSPDPVAPADGGLHEDDRGGGFAAMPVGLPPSIDYRGATWVLDRFVQADPGERSAVLAVGRADQPVLVVEGHRGLPTPAKFEVLLDGEYAGSLRLLPRDWVADMLEGDSAKPWTIVDPLEAGSERVARLEVIEGRAGRARLALAEYIRADEAAVADGRTTTVAGTELPARIEHGGRTWALGAIHEGGRGGPMTTAFADRTRVPTLIAAVDGGPGGSSYVVRRGKGEIGRAENDAGPSWQVVTVIEPGRGFEVTMLVTDGRTRQTEIALVEYYPVD